MLSNLIVLFIIIIIILEIFVKFFERKTNHLLDAILSQDELIKIVTGKYEVNVEDIHFEHSRHYSYNPISRVMCLMEDSFTGSDIIKGLHEFSHAVFFDNCDPKVIQLSMHIRIASWISIIISIILFLMNVNDELLSKFLIIGIVLTTSYMVISYYFERKANAILISLEMSSDKSVERYILVSEILQLMQRAFLPFLMFILLLQMQ